MLNIISGDMMYNLSIVILNFGELSCFLYDGGYPKISTKPHGVSS